MARLQWLWRYNDSETERPIGSGKLTTTSKADAEGFYRIRSIRGERDGVPIKRLLPRGNGIPGNVDPITGQAYVGDNLIRAKGDNPEAAQLTSKGVVFSLINKTHVNLFHLNLAPVPANYEFFSAPPYPAGPVPPNTESTIHFDAWIRTSPS